ncbi:MAG TPA: hypothetical protein VFQ24_11985 [Terriglobia bacterium]|nr:hypothetical protein [Terriglobia bacterium]
MGPQVSESSARSESAEGCVVLVFSTDRDFLEHYRGVFLSLGFVPITAATVEAALAILRLMVVAFVVVDQSSGIEADRNILKRVQSAQPHALALVIAEQPDPLFRREALALGAAEYLHHPADSKDFAHAFHLVCEEVQ